MLILSFGCLRFLRESCLLYAFLLGYLPSIFWTFSAKPIDFYLQDCLFASSAQMSVPSVSRATNIVISPLYLLFLLILRYALCLCQKTRYFPFTTPSDT